MVVFERKSYIVQAWRLPDLGSVADEAAPPWLVSRMQSGDLQINGFGGLTAISPWGVAACASGDYVILTEDDTIQFCKANEFNHKFTLLAESLAA